MNGEPEAIARVPPAPAASGELNASQSTAFIAATPTAAIPIPGAVVAAPINAAGGCWITFVWFPTVADQAVRLCFGGSGVANATATDRAFVPYTEHDYWCPIGFTHFKGLSAGGGELSWHRSSR